MKYTTNKRLKLPDYTDVVDVQNFNDNFTTVDAHMGESVVSDTGAHGFRYNKTSRVFEFYNPESSSWSIFPDVFLPPKKTLNNTSWEDISTVSNLGIGANYWAIGDRKSVAIKGTVGTISINRTCYAYILGFNHNNGIEGSGIQFGCFKTALSGGADACFADNKYNSQSSDGSKYFSMNHSGQSNAGGWKESNIRYDVLGSTNTVGADAGAKTATNPVSNTLLAAFPTELRSVMKPIRKYTDNVGGGTDTATNVTATIDYLPLLSEYEIFGKRTHANSAEQNYQMQYTYYAVGNSKLKYIDPATSGASAWFERSPACNTSRYFCVVNISGVANSYYSNFSLGLAPVFMV